MTAWSIAAGLLLVLAWAVWLERRERKRGDKPLPTLFDPDDKP